LKGALLFFGPLVLLPGLFVLWIGALFGRVGALVALAIVATVALGKWMLPTTGAHGPTIFMIIPLPMALGALLGLLVWYLWLGRPQKQT
jgi:hypothetical protein